VKKVRIDLLLVERGLAESRTQAQRLVMAGQVRVDGQMVLKPSTLVPPQAGVERQQGPRFVSRGGEKLEAALIAFRIEAAGIPCADVGASTGGFTDCLLQHGAEKVYAIDVGKGLLHWQLRNDRRVIVMEATNARFLESLPEKVGLVTVDAAFISLKMLLPVIKNWLRTEGEVIALIKPQFEAGRSQSAKGDGVIRDPAVHRQVLLEVMTFARSIGFGVGGLIRSPLRGPKGNVEFLARLSTSAASGGSLAEWVEGVLVIPGEVVPPQT